MGKGLFTCQEIFALKSPVAASEGIIQESKAKEEEEGEEEEEQ